MLDFLIFNAFIMLGFWVPLILSLISLISISCYALCFVLMKKEYRWIFLISRISFIVTSIILIINLYITVIIGFIGIGPAN